MWIKNRLASHYFYTTGIAANTLAAYMCLIVLYLDELHYDRRLITRIFLNWRNSAVASWIERFEFELCSWTRHFTLTVPLSTQVYKWVIYCWG